jgi:hypothetical protein
MWRGVALLLLVALGWACGGDEQSGDDRQTAQALLRSSAAVGRAMSPLYLCDAQEPSCYRAAGREALAVVPQERARFAAALAETDNECLREAGDLFDDALGAYAEAARAAAAGDVAATDAAVSRSTRSEIAYVDKVGDCGFSEGRFAEVQTAQRTVNADVLRIVQELEGCSELSCVQAAARRLEAKAREGVAHMDELMAGLRELAQEEDTQVPGCLERGLEWSRQSFAALERTAVAIQAADVEAAEREGSRSDELAAQSQEEIARCITALGG